MGIKVGPSGEQHPGPAIGWALAFVICGIGDALLGRWVLTPVFVAAFYAGMVVIDLVTYPILSFWRNWLQRRGLWAWYLVEVVGLWGAELRCSSLFLLLSGSRGAGMECCCSRYSEGFCSWAP
ncbi:hypothetical protein BH24ACT22_BH24ACT22_15280 [soil metagenome]